MYDFNKIIDRKGTSSWKYDFYEEYNKPSDTLSMWIADMDFPTVPEVVKKMEDVAAFGIYGYARPMSGYYEALKNWYKTHFDADFENEQVVFTPGIVFALNMAVKTYTNEGDGVLVMRPVYYPFLNAIKNNKRKLINSPLVYSDGKYSINFDDLEKKIVDEKVKLMLFCNPHNPVGRVYTKDELDQVAEVARKHGVFVCADEIHSDFVYGDNKHISFLNIDRENCMVCTAPSKTFNLAGLQTSNIIIPSDSRRAAYRETVTSTGYEYPNIFGLNACEAAYRHGEQWLKELLSHIYGNYEYMVDFCKKKMPRVKIADLQGTYLPWFDMSAYGLSDEEILTKLEKDARIWLDEGTLFGTEGSGFIRFNIACPRDTVVQAMDRLYEAFEK